MVALRKPEPELGPPARTLAPARSERLVDRVPLPTSRFVRLLAFALSPALLAVIRPEIALAAVILVALLAIAFVVDALRLRRQQLRGARPVPELLHAFSENALALELENAGDARVSGAWLDAQPGGVDATGELALAPNERLVLALKLSPPRGLLNFGDVHVRVEGPWQLAARHARLAASGSAKSYPDLREPGDELLLARARQDGGLARLRRLGEGREFDALRPYREGDDLRSVDWKASARRASLVSREYVPEKNQALILLLDCGRLFVAQERGRSRLDFAIEAALRLARTSLERGDAVGLIAFGASVRAFVPPAKGRMHLRTLTEAVYALQPELEESDYGAAFDLLGKATTRRALVCTFTDLVDEDASRVLVARTAALRPKHLPLLVTLVDAELTRIQDEIPHSEEAAFARAAATRLLRERSAAMARLRQVGATVVSAPSNALTAEALNAYLRIKARGLL
ncbi:MAG: DUF58 domain-containing protein [Deltaproteobacteria bacterium]|nr:DUF58 domain-containing protein [Deltaproteobacteria bacterium]